MPRGDKPTTTALALKDGWIYEDALPSTITKEQYDCWHRESLVLDGVRMGPPMINDNPTNKQASERIWLEAEVKEGFYPRCTSTEPDNPSGFIQYTRAGVSEGVADNVHDSHELCNALQQAAIEVHVGFQHPRKWEDCDLAICNERKRLTSRYLGDANSTPDANDAERDQAFREFWREQDRERPFDYARPERYATFTKRYAPPAPSPSVRAGVVTEDALKDLFALFTRDPAGRWNFNSLSRDETKFDEVMERLYAAATNSIATKDEQK